MTNVLLRWLVLALGIGTLTGILAGCLLPYGGYGYDDSVSIGVDYYEPYGAHYDGWGPGYQVAPFRGGDHRPAVEGGRREATHSYRPAPANRPTPSLPSRGGGGRGDNDKRGGSGKRGAGGDERRK